MSEGFPYADIVILALIAGFILLRLRSVLGSRNEDKFDYGARPASPLNQQIPKQEPIVQVDEKSLKPKPPEETDPYLLALGEGPVAEGLKAVMAKDPSFSPSRFLLGARSAFEMTFDAFAKSDRATLRMLLAEPVFQHFCQEIEARSALADKPETTLVSVAAKDITHAALDGTVATITVHFASEQVTVTRGPKGEIIEGDPSEIHHVEDEWVFQRDVTSKNPNWKIIET